MQVQPYLFFDGRCEEAIEFYCRALGAEVIMLMRFKQSPEPHEHSMVPPGAEDKVMHASFRIGETTLSASDGQCQGQPNFQGIFPVAHSIRRGGGRPTVCCVGRRRARASGANEDLLFPAIRHAHRPLWRGVDGLRHTLTVFKGIFRRQEVHMAIWIGVAVVVLIIAAVAFIATRPASFRIQRSRVRREACHPHVGEVLNHQRPAPVEPMVSL